MNVNEGDDRSLKQISHWVGEKEVVIKRVAQKLNRQLIRYQTETE